MHAKKYLIGGAVAAGLLVLLVGWTTFQSLGRVWWNRGTTAVKNMIPLEDQLARARILLKDVDPAMKNAMHLIATEDAYIEKLESDVEKEGRAVATLEAKVKEQHALVKGRGDGSVQAVGETKADAQVKSQLATNFKLFQSRKVKLAAMEKELASKQRTVDARRAQYTAMKSKKEELKAQIEMLEAKLAEVKAQETVSDVVINDSELSQTKELLDEIDMQIRIRDKVAAESATFNETEATEAPAEGDITEQIDDYFKTAPAGEEGPKT